MAPRSVHRSASTFKPRRRRLSAKRRADLDRWLERWGVDAAGPPLDWAELFGPAPRHGAADGPPHPAPSGDAPSGDAPSGDRSPAIDVVLDVGFGHGESVLDLARRARARARRLGIIGVEVHTPGVATVLEAVEKEGLDDVRIAHADALALLDRVPADSLHEIRILFPDPWPKERQQHRRLVRADVVAACTDRLRVGGTLRLATDDDDYAAAMLAACATDVRLEGGRFDDAPDRPTTRFEQRALAAGRRTTDLVYLRVR